MFQSINAFMDIDWFHHFLYHDYVAISMYLHIIYSMRVTRLREIDCQKMGHFVNPAISFIFAYFACYGGGTIVDILFLNRFPRTLSAETAIGDAPFVVCLGWYIICRSPLTRFFDRFLGQAPLIVLVILNLNEAFVKVRASNERMLYLEKEYPGSWFYSLLCGVLTSCGGSVLVSICRVCSGENIYSELGKPGFSSKMALLPSLVRVTCVHGFLIEEKISAIIHVIVHVWIWSTTVIFQDWSPLQLLDVFTYLFNDDWVVPFSEPIKRPTSSLSKDVSAAEKKVDGLDSKIPPYSEKRRRTRTTAASPSSLKSKQSK